MNNYIYIFYNLKNNICLFLYGPTPLPSPLPPPLSLPPLPPTPLPPSHRILEFCG